MTEPFRAIAADFDGTLTEAGRPSEAVLQAIGETRLAGRKFILVTGRILSELREVFADVDEHFDGIVAENGAVVCVGGTSRVLAPPVDFELDEALVARAVSFRRGQVLVATRVEHDVEVNEEIRRLGLECQLTRNRGEMMILPPGVSKGFGVFQLLGDLGISHHDALAIGDAENDHSLLGACELGVAVANAVPGLKRHADLVLEQPDGAGVVELLRGPLLRGGLELEPRRWRIELGRYPGGGWAALPASRVNVLVVGPSKSGKSFLASHVAEQLIGLGYSVCVLDPEGDYAHLGRLRGVLALECGEPLAEAGGVGRLIEHRFGSVVFDASQLDPSRRDAWMVPLLVQLYRERTATGLPHWILVDEAHEAFRSQPPALELSRKGHLLVTYDLRGLPVRAWQQLDFVLGLPACPDAARQEAGEGATAVLVEKLGKEFATALGSARFGQAVLARLGMSEPPRLVDLTRRASSHVRHWHKYAETVLPPQLHFLFRDASAHPRHVARNVEEFHRILVTCAPDVLRHHAARGDFSQWLRDAVRDTAIACFAQECERDFRDSGRGPGDVDTLRGRLARALERRYLG